MAHVKGKPKTGGRTKGTPNKSTLDVKGLAAAHGPEAIETLVSIMQNSEDDKAKISAANALLDRAYGKPSQSLTGPDGAQLVVKIIRGVSMDDL